jgi:hypothetical protein
VTIGPPRPTANSPRAGQTDLRGAWPTLTRGQRLSNYVPAGNVTVPESRNSLKTTSTPQRQMSPEVGRRLAKVPRTSKTKCSASSYGRYYPDAQARDGANGYFYGVLRHLHTAEPGAKSGTVDRSTGVDGTGGDQKSMALFVGQGFRRPYPASGRPQRCPRCDLYNKITPPRAG